MKTISITVLLLVVLALPWSSQAEKEDELPRLPGAELLVEGYSSGRFLLLLTTEEKTVTLQEDAIPQKGSPSISANGSVVASAHAIAGDLSSDPKLIANTYYTGDGKWTDHPEVEGVWGPVAISPDGSELACVTNDRPAHIRDVSDLLRSRLEILDLKTGKVKVATGPSERPGPTGISWSPDGRQIAFVMPAPGREISSEIEAIYVLNVETGVISQIGLGQSPSWSPSGEWIAYAGYVEAEKSEPGGSTLYNGRYYSLSWHQFKLMGPNGTHSRVLMGFRSDVEDNAAAVWSPDSKELLLTKVHGPDKATFDIYLYDLATHKLRKKFSNTFATVYAWVAVQ